MDLVLINILAVRGTGFVELRFPVPVTVASIKERAASVLHLNVNTLKFFKVSTVKARQLEGSRLTNETIAQIREPSLSSFDALLSGDCLLAVEEPALEGSVGECDTSIARFTSAVAIAVASPNCFALHEDVANAQSTRLHSLTLLQSFR